MRTVLSALILPLCACGGMQSGPPGEETSTAALPVALSQRVAVDGQIDFGVFAQIEATELAFVDITSGASTRATQLRWAIANDDRDVYFAFEWSDPTLDNDFDPTLGPTSFDGVQLLFDVDGDGTLEAGEDKRTVLAASVGSHYIDQHVASGDETDSIGDGLGKLRHDAARAMYQAEFLFPLTPDQAGEDGTLTPASRYNVVLFDGVRIAGPAGSTASLFGPGTVATAWSALPIVSASAHERSVLPTDLSGLIAFVSTHESPRGEIYTFDPATRTTRRVTTAPDLFKDSVSLSHDRSRIAFHAAPKESAFAAYEIYVVNVSGSELRQLTSNGIVDGHPAWSNDDSRIAYASFRDPHRASIVVMSAEGVEIDVLTPPGTDDNDPEYLPDDRIIFKTDRFSTLPEVRIAVMSEAGANVQQLTNVAGTSDHDPVGDGSSVVFERFPKGTNFATDVEAGFVGWDILVVGLDGTGPTLLRSDGFTNWLPVFAPSGRYIAYQRSAGYTDVRLMTRDGQDLGRLIPNITQVRYTDWK